MDEVSFDIETQAAAAITNIGGDQTIYAAERRSRVPNAASVVGLLLFLSALGLLVVTGINTANTLRASDFWPSDFSYYTAAIPDTWLPAVILVVTGFVISCFGRALRRV
jgi:hypothetical protein